MPTLFSRSYTRRLVCLTLALASSISWCILPAYSSGRPTPRADTTRAVPDKITQRRVIGAYGKLPLGFSANQGQIDPQVKFYSRGIGYTLFLTSTEVVLTLHKSALDETFNKPAEINKVARTKTAGQTQSTLRIRLVGSRPSPQVRGLDLLPGRSNYFIGNDSRNWFANVASYARVQYQDAYPGVSLLYYGNQGQLEYDFVIAPGADPGVIKLAYEGADKIGIDAGGDLILYTAAGEVRQSKPYVYQELGGAKKEISARYVVNEKREINIQTGAYDKTRPLVIDPVLSYSTYLGGSLGDSGQAIAVDSAGNAYVAGFTPSLNFPVGPSAFQTSNAGGEDAFVAKLNSAGSGLVYSTYLGGSGQDLGFGLAVDSAGKAYVAGRTGSANFPTTPSAFQPVIGGAADAFVTVLNPDGTSLFYSTYLGGSSSDGGQDVAVDPAGNVYTTGETNSTNFPTTAGAFQTALAEGPDAFVTKLNPMGTGLVYSTYLGGSSGCAGSICGNGFDDGLSVAPDSAGNAYVTGITISTNFPVTPGAYQTTYGEFFVTKLNPTATALVYSTYLGGGGEPGTVDIAVDSAGNAYLTGQAGASYPTTPGAFQTDGDNCDAFVTKLNGAGTALIYSTFLGGPGCDAGLGIAVDSSGSAHVAGVTQATTFPTKDPLQPAYGGGVTDFFVTKLNTTGTALDFSTFLGGSGEESGGGVALDATGNIYVAGQTSSINFPVTPGAFQTTYQGGVSDAFVSKIAVSSFDTCLKDSGSGNSFQFNSTTGEYLFTECGAGGLTLRGTGVVSRRGCLVVLDALDSGNRVKAHINHCNGNGQAVVQIGSGKKRTFVITDKDTADGACSCS